MKFHFYSDTPVSIYQQIASQPAVLNMPLTLTKSEKPVYKQKKVKKKRSVKPAKKSQSNKAFTLIKVGVFSTIGAVLAQLMFRTPFLAALSLYLASNAVENKVFQGIYKGQGKLNSRMLQGLYKLSTGKNKSADAFTQSDRLKVLPALSTFTSLSFEIILAGLNFLIGNERRQAAIKKKMISVTDFLKLNKVNTKNYQSQLRLLGQKSTRFFKKYLVIPK